jgi:Protein of unknown function (DUF3237)
MPETSLPVEHLFTLTATLGGRSLVRRGPSGTRVIVYVTGGTFSGNRLRGAVVENSGADWVTQREDGSFRLDVRITLKTDDGADIYMAYGGVGVIIDGQNVIRSAPLFETGDERYAWLNRVQAVGIGHSNPDTVVYEIYALAI